MCACTHAIVCVCACVCVWLCVYVCVCACVCVCVCVCVWGGGERERVGGTANASALICNSSSEGQQMTREISKITNNNKKHVIQLPSMAHALAKCL